MCSLDAIAEACSDGRKDSVGPDSIQMLGAQPQERSSTPVALSEPVSDPFESRRETTLSTVSCCPLDMARLERQNQGEEHDTAHHRDESEAKTTWPNVAIPEDDPFDDTNVVHSGSPSPSRSVSLPFRPKKSSEDAESTPTPVDDASDYMPDAQYSMSPFQFPASDCIYLTAVPSFLQSSRQSLLASITRTDNRHPAAAATQLRSCRRSCAPRATSQHAHLTRAHYRCL